MKKLLPALALALGTLPAAAQLESPLLSKIQPNLVNPGGKSLAMGGAFVSLADDASAAFANPAGLTQLSSYQVGASGKRFAFTPTLSTANFIQTQSGGYESSGPVDRYEPDGRATELEFAAAVIPLFSDLVLAAYTGVNLRFDLDGSKLVGGNYRAFSIRRFTGGENVYSIDEQGGVSLRNRLYGLSLGLKLGKRISVGGGVNWNKLEYDLTGGAAGGSHLFITNATNLQLPGSTQPAFQTSVTATLVDSTKLGWVVGAKVEILETSRLSIGAVYRHAPGFDVGYSIDARRLPTGAQLARFSCGVDDPNIPNSGASACGTFKIPDDWAVGISAAPIPSLLLSFELQRVRYSQFQEGFVPLFVYCQDISVPACPADKRAISLAKNEDGYLPRFGAEYSLPIGATDLSLRAGYYREPAHGMTLDLFPDANRDRRADATPPIVVADPPLTEAYRVSFDGGVPDNHYAFGLGATISRSFSVDVAFDLGKASTQAVASLFVRF